MVKAQMPVWAPASSQGLEAYHDAGNHSLILRRHDGGIGPGPDMIIQARAALGAAPDRRGQR